VSGLNIQHPQNHCSAASLAYRFWLKAVFGKFSIWARLGKRDNFPVDSKFVSYQGLPAVLLEGLPHPPIPEIIQPGQRRPLNPITLQDTPSFLGATTVELTTSRAKFCLSGLANCYVHHSFLCTKKYALLFQKMPF